MNTIIKTFRNLSRFEFCLWTFSLFSIVISSVIFQNADVTKVLTSLIGVTALIFVAKGHVLGQILTVCFGLCYGLISLKYGYYGEMITCLGMSMPIAIITIITWIKNPYEGTNEVKVSNLNARKICILITLTISVTIAFYFILKFFNTKYLIFSTLSVTTSFLAASLTTLRSEYYALAYTANDVILIILWIFATTHDISYLSMVICFLMFLLNDLYGFVNWKKMKKRQI